MSLAFIWDPFLDFISENQRNFILHMVDIVKENPFIDFLGLERLIIKAMTENVLLVNGENLVVSNTVEVESSSSSEEEEEEEIVISDCESNEAHPSFTTMDNEEFLEYVKGLNDPSLLTAEFIKRLKDTLHPEVHYVYRPSRPPTTVPISGVVIDGIVAGASVKLLDKDGDEIGTAVTTGDGKYTANVPKNKTSNGVRLEVPAGEGIDISTGKPTSITMRSSMTSEQVSSDTPSSVVVSPLTTMVEQAVEEGSSREEATSKVARVLDIPEDAVNGDYVANKDTTVTKKVLQIVNIASTISEKAPNTSADDVINAMVKTVTNKDIPISLTNNDVLEEIITEVQTNEDASEMPAVLDTASLTVFIKKTNQVIDDAVLSEDGDFNSELQAIFRRLELSQKEYVDTPDDMLVVDTTYTIDEPYDGKSLRVEEGGKLTIQSHATFERVVNGGQIDIVENGTLHVKDT